MSAFATRDGSASRCSRSPCGVAGWRRIVIGTASARVTASSPTPAR
jgi:hypothetical protein